MPCSDEGGSGYTGVSFSGARIRGKRPELSGLRFAVLVDQGCLHGPSLANHQACWCHLGSR